MKKPMKQAMGDFLAGRGFYIVLFLCVAAIGVSGWYLMSELVVPGGAPVGGAAVVTVSPTPEAPTAVPPVVEPRPTPTARPAPTPLPSETPAVSLWGSEIYTWPVKGEVISDFSLEVLAYDDTMGDWRVHEGLDLSAEVGAAVKAVNAGTVTAVYRDDLMGSVVEMEHADGLRSLYANLAADPAVKVGDALDTAAVLGAVGETAIAETAKPAHLHFEMSKNGEAVDPVTYLPAR